MNMISEVADENSKSETTLGALINKCGKMRMLSHRVVLTLLVENSKTKACPEALNDVEKNITEFAQIAADITPESRNSELPPALQSILADVDAVTQNQSEDLSRFVSIARAIQAKLYEPVSARRTESIEELADFVKTTLLDTLNAIVEGMNRALHYVVSQRQSHLASQSKTIRSSISELEKISRMIMIISVNASIEASRVGAEGRGFSAVAGEIRNLSQSANKVITSLGAQYARDDRI
jgi:methyl-accepting chemotaxis protein